jgi:predicted ArsR family transcriptional regulator
MVIVRVGEMVNMTKALRAAAVLDDATRQRIFAFVRAAGRPVSREEVAAEAGISRKLAAFHLDKLLQRELLVSHYARPPGRSGPGAGRTSKMYEPSEVQVEVSIPERRYDLVGELLVDAVEDEQPGESSKDAAIRTAHDRGASIGAEIRRTEVPRRPGPERTLSVAARVLEAHGFEPFRDGADLALRNCPFQSLARRAPDLVCEMNEAFLDGLIRGLGNDSVEAALTRTPGRCCVTLRPPARR